MMTPIYNIGKKEVECATPEGQQNRKLYIGVASTILYRKRDSEMGSKRGRYRPNRLKMPLYS